MGAKGNSTDKHLAGEVFRQFAWHLAELEKRGTTDARNTFGWELDESGHWRRHS